MSSSSKRKSLEKAGVEPSSKTSRSNKAIHPFFTKASDSKSLVEDESQVITWTYQPKPGETIPTLLVGTSKNFEINSFDRVLALDLDSTLIKVKGGHTYPKSADDWQWFSSKVISLLKKHHGEGMGIVIFSNQGGFAATKLKDKVSKKFEDFKVKLNNIVQQLDLPVLVMAATGKDRYRKPRVGMWEYLEELAGKPLDKKGSLFVGDAAGRPANPAKNAKKDFSDTDRKLALNLGIDFKTPEQFFLGEEPGPYSLSGFQPKAYIEKLDLQPLKPLVINPPIQGKPELILLVGLPGSGKTTFFKTYLEPLGFHWINNDTTKTKKHCQNLTEHHLSSKEHVVLDNTNVDVSTRKQYIDIAKKYKATVRCFDFGCDFNLSKHNSLYRALGTPVKTGEIIPDLVLRSMGNKFTSPTLEEGIDSITEVQFDPKFATEEDKNSWCHFYF